MNKYKLLLVTSASVLTAAAVSMPASAQILDPGTPTTETVGTVVVNTFDAVTETLTTTSTVEELVSVTYSDVVVDEVISSFGGQDVVLNSNFSADTVYTQFTDTVSTTTPDPDIIGQFIETGPTTGTPTDPSNSAVTNLAGNLIESTPITGMGTATLDLSNASGATADFTKTLGLVTTDFTVYGEEAGTATFDPVTGEITYVADSVKVSELNVDGLTVASASVDGVSVTTLASDGLTTTGSVSANLVEANDVLLDGVSLVSTIADLNAADVTLQGNIDAEAATRAAADTAEAAARIAADTVLGGRITTEVADRTAADTAEAATRAAADTAEAAARIAADTALGGRITTEVANRTAADTAIGVRIGAEETARAAADTAIGTRITTESNARIAADLAESNSRIAGDNALGTRITNETNARIAADDVLRDQIASSTATAIALGGTAILPDANFTLGGNMGFYNGATAVSINAAGKVGSNTYITAAVGGGLNKQGKVGGRVGVVFGF